jgi:hypothetical protein
MLHTLPPAGCQYRVAITAALQRCQEAKELRATAKDLIRTAHHLRAAKYPETQYGKVPGKAGGKKVAKAERISACTVETAAQTGVTPCTVQQERHMAASPREVLTHWKPATKPTRKNRAPERLKLYSVSLTPVDADLLATLARQATDEIGRSINTSAVLRAILRLVGKKMLPTPVMIETIERERRAGRIWGTPRR